MTEKVLIEYRENLPMPLIYLASAEDLARWQVDQLTWALQQGHRSLTISCFDTASMSFDVGRASLTVLRAVMDFLYDHSEVEQLTVLCGDEAAYRAYSFQFNMWFAAHKPKHDE